MKKTVIIIAALLVAAGLDSMAQSKTLTAFVDKVSSSAVSFDYSYSFKSPKYKSTMTGIGDVKVQGSSFVMNGNGLEVWCDGSTIWTVDRMAEEALIESVDDSADSYATNPALLVSAVDEAFREVSFGAANFKGASVDASVLEPLNKGKYSMDIALLKLYFKKGSSSLEGAEVTLNDGSVSVFTISGLSFSDRLETKESFRFDEKTLEDSYVITDLR